jgi:hypothetical protein
VERDSARYATKSSSKGETKKAKDTDNSSNLIESDYLHSTNEDSTTPFIDENHRSIAKENSLLGKRKGTNTISDSPNLHQDDDFTTSKRQRVASQDQIELKTNSGILTGDSITATSSFENTNSFFPQFDKDLANASTIKAKREAKLAGKKKASKTPNLAPVDTEILEKEDNVIYQTPQPSNLAHTQRKPNP